MRILALITARGGSKRLPGKNIRVLGDKPLIVWTIDIARRISGLCDILLSTDDSAIAEVARDAGAMVPWLRPKELATGDSTSVDVCLHALDWYEKKYGKIDGLLLLQPTSPFRRYQTIMDGIKLFEQETNRPVLGVSKLSDQIVNDVCGSFYLIHPSILRRERTFFTNDSMPLLMKTPEECLDIDTENDWQHAKLFL